MIPYQGKDSSNREVLGRVICDTEKQFNFIYEALETISYFNRYNCEVLHLELYEFVSD